MGVVGGLHVRYPAEAIVSIFLELLALKVRIYI